ncbi:hypothetical protein RUND412_007687 [Rhizina undulata]
MENETLSNFECFPVEILVTIIANLRKRDIANLRAVSRKLHENVSPKHIFQELVMHVVGRDARTIANIIKAKNLSSFVEKFTFECLIHDDQPLHDSGRNRRFAHAPQQIWPVMTREIAHVLLSIPLFPALKKLTISFSQPSKNRFVPDGVKLHRWFTMKLLHDAFIQVLNLPTLEELQTYRIAKHQTYLIPYIPTLKNFNISTITDYGEGQGIQWDYEIRSFCLAAFSRQWKEWMQTNWKLEVFEYHSEHKVPIGYWPAVEWSGIYLPNLRRLLLGDFFIGGPEFEAFLKRHDKTLEELVLIRPCIVVRDEGFDVYDRTWAQLLNYLKLCLKKLLVVDIQNFAYIELIKGLEMFGYLSRDDEEEAWISLGYTITDIPPYGELDRAAYERLKEEAKERGRIILGED